MKVFADVLATLRETALHIEGQIVNYAKSQESRFPIMVTHEEAIALHALASAAHNIPFAAQAETAVEPIIEAVTAKLIARFQPKIDEYINKLDAAAKAAIEKATVAAPAAPPADAAK